MNLYDIAVARKLSSGGGGGGGSDTATVTVIGGGDGALFGVVLDMSEEFGMPAGTYPSIINYVDGLQSGTYTIVLWEGNTIAAVPGVTVSGSIELIDEDNYVYKITGDCTIDFS